MSLLDWFTKGMTTETYISSMTVHQDNLLGVYNKFNISEEDRQSLQGLQTKGIKAVVLTADWCGDAMVNLPIFIRLAAEALVDIRYLIRDENLELMDQYLTNGKSRSIPIIVFLDSEGNELGKWGPRAESVQQLVDELRKDVPDKEDPCYEEAFKKMIKSITEQFATNSTLWEDVKQDLIQVMKRL
ncbi:thioredoxin family protein [Bacillus sp. AK128]